MTEKLARLEEVNLTIIELFLYFTSYKSKRFKISEYRISRMVS